MSSATVVSEPIQKPQTQLPLLEQERFLGLAMLLPAVIYIVLMVGIPFVLAILLSFSDATVGNPEIDRLSLDTFRALLQDRVFLRALVNTFAFTLISQTIMIVMANTLAVVLTRQFPGKWLVRLLILLPWATPIAIGVIGWLWMLDSVYSPIDWIFRNVGLLGPAGLIKSTSNMYWLGEPGLAVFSVILVHVWRMLPMSTVIIMAGLASVPGEIKDAAAVDGAGFWNQYFRIILPLIRPMVIVAFLFGFIFTFTDMTVIHVLTRGGPINNTQVLASWAYYRGIEGGNLSQGAATAIFMLPVLLVISIIMLRIARRTEIS